jgi:PAS domain S-box-containing protein
MDHLPASLDNVLITAELWRRPTRLPDYAAEGRVLTALAEAMADSPQTILEKLVETALTLCRADSAGISILEPRGASGVFRWHAVAGQFASNNGGEMPREASPSGIVLDRDVSLLFSYPERHFDYGMTIAPPIVEALLVPFHSEGKPVGTLWLISHTPSRKFDREDQRVLTSLSHFASTAYQVKMAALTAVRAKEDVRQILDTAAIGLTRCSRDLRYLACNRAYEKIVGLSTEQIIGRPIIDVLGTKAFEVIRPYIERVLHGEHVEFELEVPISAGGPRFFHVVDEPWFDSEGQVAGWIASVSEITDLKRTTKALLESEERLRLAMSSGTIGVWDWDMSSGQFTVSPEVGRIYGVDVTNLRSYEDFAANVHPDDLATVEFERNVAIRNHEPFDTEFRILLPSGEIRWIAARGQAYYDGNGRVVRVVGNNIDITERVETKEALREREQKLRLALDASGAGSWMRDARTGHIDWDDRFRKLYGFTAQEPASLEAWLSRVHEEDRQQVVELVEQIRHTKTHDTFDSTFRIVRPDGAVSWIQSVGQAHRDAEGQLTWLTGLELDVTERRRSEEALKTRRDQERDRTLQLLLETAPLGILSVEAQGIIITANRALETMFGWPPGELIGQCVDQLVAPALQDRHAARRAAYFATPRPLYLGGGLDLVGQRKDGSTFPVEVSLNHVPTADGGHAIAFVTDISERKRQEEALQQSHAELERRTLQLSRLASQLTLAEQSVRKQLASTLHDGLQQLLFSAGITLDQAVKPNSQDDQAALLQKARAVVKEAIEAARTLTVNLFPPVLHVGGLPAALSWLAKRTQEQYSVIINVTADRHANPETSEVRVLLFEAVRELLFNAVKHARVDRVDVNLALGPGNTIHIQVSDDGAGFDPSATLYDRNHPQAGLGLFSIQERFALLGGHLDIVSAPGKGSRFTLTLPRTGLTDLATDNRETPRRDTDRQERLVNNFAGGTSKSLRILIADDHAVVRAGLRELLSERPELRVVGEAANGVEAISYAKSLQPDVILMDVEMPQKNGIDATREIHDSLPHIQIVGLSTYGDETTERAMREAGAQAYFSKTESTHRLFDYVLSLRPHAKGASGT